MTRPFDFSQLPGGGITVLPATTPNPVVGDVLAVQSITANLIQLRYTTPSGAAGFYLPLTGGTLTGPLTLPGPPTLDLHAATKAYTDAQVSAALVTASNTYLPRTGGTISGGLTVTGSTVLNGGSLFGTYAGNLTFSGSPSITNNLTINGILTNGSDTAGQRFFNINAAAGQNKNIQWQSAGLNRWSLRSDTSAETGSDAGSEFILRGFTDAGVSKGELLRFNRKFGVQRFTPYPVVFSGNDAGTPGLSMTYSQSTSYSGITTSPAAVTFNRWWVTGDTLTDNDQGTYFHFQGDYGPASSGGGGGGRTALQCFLRTAGDLSAPNDMVLNGFRAHSQAIHDGGAATSAAGGAYVQAMDLNAELLHSATGWSQVVIAQINASVSSLGQNNLHARKGIFLTTGMDTGTQGGRHDAAFSVALGPASTNPGGTPNPTYPAPGMGWRYLMGIGNGGTTAFALDYFNGEVLGTLPAIMPPVGATNGIPPQVCLHGINLAKVNFGESAWWSPGVKIAGDGTTRIKRLQVSAGANGPIIDAPLSVASITSISASTNNLYAGEQVYDHLGGVAIVDTVDGTNRVTAAHYLYPPNVAAGDVVTVASGIVAIQGGIGDTVIRLRRGTYGVAVGDVVSTANAVAGIPAGAGVTVWDVSPIYSTITLSGALTAVLPVGTMLLFRQTMPASIVTFRTGSRGFFSANVTWAAATTLSLGTGAATILNIGNAGSNTSVSGTFTTTGAASFGSTVAAVGPLTLGAGGAGSAAITQSGTGNFTFTLGGSASILNFRSSALASILQIGGTANNITPRKPIVLTGPYAITGAPQSDAALYMNQTWTGSAAIAQSAQIFLQSVENVSVSGDGSLAGLYVKMTGSGAGILGNRQAGFLQYVLSSVPTDVGTGAAYNALNIKTDMMVGAGGTALDMVNTLGTTFGFNPVVHLGPLCQFWRGAICTEFDVWNEPGSSVMDRVGLAVVLIDNSTGTVARNNIALTFNNQGIEGATSNGWKTLIALGKEGGHIPLASDGTIMRYIKHDVGIASPTIGAGIDLTGLTISGNAFASPGFAVSGAGKITTALLTNAANDAAAAGAGVAVGQFYRNGSVMMQRAA